MTSIVYEVVTAHGHPNVRATHKSTLEITREDYLTPRGDCIIGVSADKGLSGFSSEFKEVVSRDTSIVIVLFYIGDRLYDIVVGHGSSRLTYSDKTRIIIRKSSYVDGATAFIQSSKAARDLDRRFIGLLKNRDIVFKAVFIALEPSEFYSKDIPIGRIVKYLPYTKETPFPHNL